MAGDIGRRYVAAARRSDVHRARQPTGGLDADIWLTPMPNRELSRNEREEMSAVMMVRSDRLDIDPHVWTPNHLTVIRAAAQEPSVQRIFVNAAIESVVPRSQGRSQLALKVRPMYGHDYHFHIRIRCPAGSGECESQPEPKEGEACSPATSPTGSGFGAPSEARRQSRRSRSRR